MKVLVIDIGNSNIKIGVVSDGVLMCSWRCNTDIRRTADEYGLFVVDKLNSANISCDSISAVALSSVVPHINFTMSHMVQYYLRCDMFVVDSTNCGMDIAYANAQQLGTDRICGCVEAVAKYGCPLILVDFGTATTYNVVDERGAFKGGVITLGIKSTVDALVANTACLPEVGIVRPSNIVATDTTSAIQAGMYYSTVGQINNIINTISMQTNLKYTVVATGGMSTLFSDHEVHFDHIDRSLSLYGIYRIYTNHLTNGSDNSCL